MIPQAEKTNVTSYVNNLDRFMKIAQKKYGENHIINTRSSHDPNYTERKTMNTFLKNMYELGDRQKIDKSKF